jgi:hypothetical protein
VSKVGKYVKKGCQKMGVWRKIGFMMMKLGCEFGGDLFCAVFSHSRGSWKCWTFEEIARKL